jgi:PRTRC genetic system protein E
MFTSLHALAKQATLMITIAAEGDDQLRVNVTPVPFDGKAKANLPQPLSLVATAAEFDADFVAALSTWQAPKRSLVEQAQAATGTASSAAPALPAPKAAAKNDKPGKKGRGKAGADEEPAAVQAAGEAAGEAVAAADQVMVGGTGEGAETQPGAEAPTPTAQPDAAGEVVAEPAQSDSDAAPLADAGQVQAAPVTEQVDASEPVDKFTLDLF